MESVLSAADWEPLFNIKVLDPDGWDRRDYVNSWAEKITRHEFMHRANQSTCQPYDSWVASQAATHD